MPKLAASINPAATALEAPSHLRVGCFAKAKGTAPSPVATAVSSAKRKTEVAPTGSILSTLLGAAFARELPPSDLGLWIDQQQPGRRIFALGCGIDLPLQPAQSEPRVPNGVLHLGDALQTTLCEICREDYHRPGVQLDERFTDRPVQPSLYSIRGVPRPYLLSLLPGILSSLGDGPDVPQGAARPQELLVRPPREHQPLVNEETRAGEQVQELPTRVVWAVPRLSETPDELALRHSNSLQLRCLHHYPRRRETSALVKSPLALVFGCHTVPEGSGLAMSRVAHMPGKD